MLGVCGVGIDDDYLDICFDKEKKLVAIERGQM
jgi:hypothetical protein